MSRILKNTDEWYIKNAIDAVEDKRVGLPSFQRGDVWAYRKILDLLHSVCVGIPMGAMMAWDVAHADIQNVRDLGPAGIAGGPWVEPPLSYPERLEWLLIDGQQRTTALYRAFTPVKPRDYYIDLHALRAGEDLRECLKSAKHSKSGRDREYHLACQDSSAYTEHARLGILPFPVFLGRGGYQSWAYPAAQEFAQVTGDASWDEYLRMEITEPGGICDNVSQYKINIEVLNSETSLETLCQVFVAINTSAQDLNMFEIKVADLRADAEPFMLKEEWKAARQRHGHFDRYRVAGIDILKSLALLRSAETKGIESASSSDEWVMRLDSKFVRKHWRKLLDAYVSVLDILDRECGVLDRSLLSYSSALPPMVAAWRHANLHRARIAACRPKLVRYYWCATFAQAYIQGAGRLQGTEFTALSKWFEDDTAVPGTIEKALAESPDFWWADSWQSALFSGAIGSLLVHTKPELPDWMTDGEVRALWWQDSQKNRAEVHHIFPRTWLRDNRPDAHAETLLNKTPISGETNNWISNKAPSVYLSEMVAEIARDHGVDEAAARRLLKKRLAAHLITPEALAAMETDDYQAFLNARSVAMKAHAAALVSK